MSNVKKISGRTNDGHQFKREKRFEIRLSKVEYEAFVENFETQNRHNSFASFARAQIFGQEDFIELALKNIESANLERLQILSAISKIGTNVNQIAKKINSQYNFQPVESLNQELATIRGDLSKLLIEATK